MDSTDLNREVGLWCYERHMDLMPSFFMRLRRVDAGNPRTSAAPPLPAINPSVICTTSVMCSLSASASVRTRPAAKSGLGFIELEESLGSPTSGELLVGMGSGGEPLSTAPVDRITERSIRFWSSAKSPGHECRASAPMNCSDMLVIRLCNRAA